MGQSQRKYQTHKYSENVGYGKRVSRDADAPRAPFAVQQGKFDPELFEYLLSCEVFNIAKDADWKAHGFTRNVDHPDVPGHVYYEGYFHGMPTYDYVHSIHPRQGYDYWKPAAPLPLRAFGCALRKKNQSWTDSLIKKLDSGRGNGPATKCMIDLLTADTMFSDFAVQVHSGDLITGDSIGWHTDSPNSRLHLAMSMRGRRALHYKRYETAYAEERKEARQVAGWYEAGDFYISSPALFAHGVEYSQASSWDDRIIAVQCRFLLSMEQVQQLYRAEEKDGQEEWHFMNYCFASHLDAAPLLMPTLKEVQDQARALEAQGEGRERKLQRDVEIAEEEKKIEEEYQERMRQRREKKKKRDELAEQKLHI